MKVVPERLIWTALALAPPLLAAAEILRFHTSFATVAAVTASISLILWVPAFSGLAHEVVGGAPRRGAFGLAAGLIGVIGATNIIAVRVYRAFLATQAGLTELPETRSDATTILIVDLPGSLFPLGLFLLATALLQQDRHPRWASGALVVATLAFPIGRFWALPLLVHATDTLLCLGGLGIAISASVRSAAIPRERSHNSHLIDRP